MIELFEHNRIAYESAVSILAETGKAAVIYPTGTGKSFIGFKLCEDHPDKQILWLSPWSTFSKPCALEITTESSVSLSARQPFAEQGFSLKRTFQISGQEHPAYGNTRIFVAAVSLDSAIAFFAFRVFV